MKKTLLSLILIGATAGAGAVTPLWLRDVRISPDGSTIAFTYKGDIYTVPTNGGTARQLTTLPNSLESEPVWSPDGSKIAFASDREGTNDIFIMDAKGGEATRLTFNSASELPQAFSPDGKYVLYSAAIQDAPSALLFPASWQTELYAVPVGGGRPRQLLSTPADNLSFLPDGKSFVYVNRKGGEDQWRKHHTSSVTRDIWKYDAATKKHTNITAHAGEDRSPVLTPDGKTLYFLSERDGGSFNVYSLQMSDPAKINPLTDFTTHPVRFLSRSNNGTLAFTYDGEIYTMRDGAKPSKVSIDIVSDQPDPTYVRTFTSGSRGAVPSPDGKQVAFVNRGDVFVTSVEYPTTRQITTTPGGESSVAWGNDNRTLYYASDRDGHFNIYRATIARKEDPNFANATLINEEPVFKDNDGIDRQNPTLSPDGKKLGFVIGRRNIAVLDLASGKVTQLTHDNVWNSRSNPVQFTWSPDSKWIAAQVDMHRRSPYYDIALINVANGELTNITNTSYFDESPRWVMGGDAILFISDRYGMRSQASWGSQYDIFLIFTNQAAYDRFRLSPEDYALQNELKSAKKKTADTPAADKKKDAKKGDKADSEKAPAKKDINIELDGINDRIVRLTPFSSEVADCYIDDKGETLWFLTAFDGGYDLWKKDLRKGDISLANKLNAGSLSMTPDAAGKNLFLLGSSSMRKMALPSGKMERISFNGRQKLDPAAERDYLYDYMLKEVDARFFFPDMNGCDWKGMGEAYRKFLPHINNNHDFAELASEILGELNVSHSGGRFHSPLRADEPTASLGLLFDLTYEGPGLKVGDILAKGPFSSSDSKMVPGAIVTAINGQTIDSESDYTPLLNGIARRKTLVNFTLPSGAKVEEVVLPISSAATTDLLYDRWVKRNAHMVDSLSGGRLGYVHIRAMNDASYRPMYADLLGKYNDCEGIVIDTRFNGGGRMHEDIEVLFSGNKYLNQEIKGEVVGEMPSRRWNRPSIMLTSEANYSNAHGTPWVYKHVGIGKIVGAPVPGTMSSVNWITMQDPSLVFGIPVVGFKTAEGNYLENTQLEPDVEVLNDPSRIIYGIDDQISAAVNTLLKDIDAKKK
ncbi:MAG: S41 family peptidase [Staphylococcus sp.]|nr:S41 family peptidase [Staphylococcus sp.]